MNVLVVGATSAIAEEAARLWAARGDNVYLAARRESLLASIAEDLKLRGAKQVAFERFDVMARETHEGLITRAENAIGAMDCILVAHGTLPDQAACVADPELAVQIGRAHV